MVEEKSLLIYKFDATSYFWTSFNDFFQISSGEAIGMHDYVM